MESKEERIFQKRCTLRNHFATVMWRSLRGPHGESIHFQSVNVISRQLSAPCWPKTCSMNQNQAATVDTRYVVLNFSLIGAKIRPFATSFQTGLAVPLNMQNEHDEALWIWELSVFRLSWATSLYISSSRQFASSSASKLSNPWRIRGPTLSQGPSRGKASVEIFFPVQDIFT